MRKIITISLMVIVFFILDNTIMPFLAIYKCYPSLLFIFALCFSLINERWWALTMGLITGFLQDIHFYNGIGINLLLNMLLCVLAGEIGKNLFKEKNIIPVGTIFAFVFLKGICVYEILHLLGIDSNAYNSIYNAIYSFFIAIIMYKMIYKLFQKEYMMRNWRF